MNQCQLLLRINERKGSRAEPALKETKHLDSHSITFDQEVLISFYDPRAKENSGLFFSRGPYDHLEYICQTH